MRHIKRIAVLATASAGGALLRRRYARYEIVDRSMEPTLQTGDYVIVRAGQPMRRGSMVVYPGPGSLDLVKRVIGLPGEVIEINDGRISIDGADGADVWGHGATEPSGAWVLGPDDVFVLGDARERSTGDSRVTGGVAVGRVHGTVIGIYWPFYRASRIGS